MRTTGDPGPVSPLYEFLDEHMAAMRVRKIKLQIKEHIRSIRLRAIKRRIDDGTYDEAFAIPTVVDRLTKELQDGTME